MSHLASRTCSFSLALAALAVGLCGTSSAWEIELRPHTAIASAVVRLGDISTISGLEAADAQVLEQVVLAPGPSRSYSRSLSSSQIRKILQGRGVELDACRFIGAVRAVVVYDARARSVATTRQDTEPVNRAELNRSRPTAQPHRKPKTPWNVARPANYRARGGVALVGNVEQKVAVEVRHQLQQLAQEPTPWNVDVTISGKALRALPEQWNGLTIEGLETAVEGQHRLVACFSSDTGDVRIPVEVATQRMMEVVVPVRALKHGETITAKDVELRHVAKQRKLHTVARRLEDVVGRVVELPLRASQPVPMKAVKRPILVKRREQIEVVARRGGITIQTQVRAVDEGALGDTITVERLDDRKIRFTARVVGVQRAEVCAGNALAQRIAER